MLNKQAVLGILVLVCTVYALPDPLNHQSGLHRPLFRNGVPRVSSPNEAPPQFYTQQVIDHFSPQNKGTFPQKFYVNDTYWGGPGSPIFLILGGEGPISASDVNNHFIISQYAVQFNAMVISVEHRFYGETQPFTDTSVESLLYLTTQQALADYAQFTQYIKEDLYNCSSSPVIAWGGSYSGSLSAWFRLKYPQLIIGSIASSAPVLAQLDFQEYLVTVGNDLSPDCYNVVATATQQIEQLLTTNSSQLDSIFKTCRPILNTVNDHAFFMESITGGICGIAQYNNDNVPYQPFNLDTMCDMLTEDPDDPLQSYANVVLAINEFNGSPCTSSRYQSYIELLSLTGLKSTAGRCWTWQTCTEYGYFQTGESPNQPFSSLISLDFFTDICNDTFGPDYASPNTEWINTYYGGVDLAGSFIILPNGGVDPWHNLGVADPVNKLETAIFMTDTAHCADLYPASPNDPVDLTNTRNQEVAMIQQWLDRYYSNN